MAQRILKILLRIGALFYVSEFPLHFFGLPILEHDKIFLPTHDRYIALFALTYAVLLWLVSSDLQRYRTLLFITIGGIALGFANGIWISLHGGYGIFHVTSLDTDLHWLGWTFAAWFITTTALTTAYAWHGNESPSFRDQGRQ